MVEKRCGVAFKYHFLTKLSKVSLVSWAVWQQFSRELFLRTKRNVENFNDEDLCLPGGRFAYGLIIGPFK